MATLALTFQANIPAGAFLQRAARFLLVIVLCLACLVAEWKSLTVFYGQMPAGKFSAKAAHPGRTHLQAKATHHHACIGQCAATNGNTPAEHQHKEKVHKRSSHSSPSFRVLLSSMEHTRFFLWQALAPIPPTKTLISCDPSAPLTPPPNSVRLAS